MGRGYAVFQRSLNVLELISSSDVILYCHMLRFLSACTYSDDALQGVPDPYLLLLLILDLLKFSQLENPLELQLLLRERSLPSCLPGQSGQRR